jgi:translocation and assembly module TamB
MNMRRTAKIAAWTAGGLLGVVVLLVCGVLLVGNTESGRAYLVKMTSQLTEGKVQLTGIHGSFPASLDLDRLELRDTDGAWLWAEHISIRWSPGALLSRHIDVDSLHLTLLHVERAPVPDKEQKPSSSSSSIPETDLRSLAVDNLELGSSLAGQPTSLIVKADAHLISLEDAKAHVTARRAAGNGDYEADIHFDPKSMDATLKLQEPANGPLENLVKVPDVGALSVYARLTGPRDAEQVQLSVDAGPLKARAQGQIDLENKAADLNYSLTAPEMSPYAGLHWQRVDLQGRFHGPFTTPTAEGHLLIEGLQAPGGAQLARLDAQVKGDKGLVHLQAGIDGLQIPGPAPTLLQSSRLALNATVHLDDPQRPVQLDATHALFALQAKAITAGQQSADLTLRLPDLKPFAPLAGTKLRGDAQLTAHVNYTPTLTQLTANVGTHLDAGAAAWAGLVRGGLTQVQLAAEMTDQQFSVENLQVSGRAISLKANARAGRTGDQQMKARFDLGLANLARVSPALVGNLQVTGTVEGPRQKLSADTRLKTTVSVHGSPRGTVTARLQARGLPQAPQGVLDAEGQLDGAPLRLNLEVQPTSEGGYHAIIRHTQWKSAHADADMTLGRTVAQAHGTARFGFGQLSDLNRLLGGQFSGSVNGQAALSSASGRQRAQLDVDAQHVTASGTTANARLHANGPMDALNISLDADSPAVAGEPLRFNTSAILNMTAKELQVASLLANYHSQDVRLLQPAKVQFAQGLKIQQLKLGAQDATVELDGQVAPQLDLHAAVKQLKYSLINAFVPDLLAAGTMEADANIHGTTAAPVGSIHFQALGVRAKTSSAQGLPATDLHATADLKGDSADIQANLAAGSGSQLNVTGHAPLAKTGSVDLKLAGNLDVALLNPILEAGGRHVAGTVALDTTVTGPAASPEIGGTIRLSKGSVRDYTQGINLSDITGELSGSHGVLRIDQLTARAAPGNVSVQGTIGVLQPKIPVDLKITAKDAQPIASNIITANLNADIQVNGTAREQLDVNGKVHLNRADISIPGGLPPSVAVLDVERAGAPQKPPEEHPLVINLHLTVEAPNRILITGRGLDAEMGGELHIKGTADLPVVEGGFELQRGFFTLANSKLTFTNGTVTFNGSGLQHRLDPSLDFTASTKAAEVTAVVHITGVADAPEIELTSTPELPQDEILARLLFGEPAAQLSALQLVETGAALASLRGGGSGPGLNPVARVQKALGLDRLSVGGGSNTSSSASSQQSSGTSVEAGRYVSSRVYVGVKESTAGASQVDVDVDLTKRLKLTAQLGNGTATAQGVTPENDPGSSIGMAYQFEY